MNLSAGNQVGSITIINPTVKHGRRIYSLVRCVCGKEWETRRDGIAAGRVVSCGCKRGGKPTHGGSYLREYNIWAHMMQRCHNPRNDGYRWYGARGITVCARWHAFAAFFEDMGPSPAGHEIERIDNDRGYAPGNCKWASRYEQMQNTRQNKKVLVDGRTVSITAAAHAIGVKPQIIYTAIHGDKRRGVAGKSPQEAVDAILSRMGTRPGVGAGPA